MRCVPNERAHPDATLEQRCAWWEEAQRKPSERRHDVACAASAALDASKKSLAESLRDEAARAAWREEVSHLDARQLVLMDESGTHVALTPLYSWAPKGQRAPGQVPRNRGRITTLLAALTLEGIQAPWTIEGGTDALAFETYVLEVLAPTLKPGQIVFLDNLAAHQGAAIRHLVEARGCTLRFLPSYAPDLTPIRGGVLQDQNTLAPGSCAGARGVDRRDRRGGSFRDERRCSWLVSACRVSPSCPTTLRTAVRGFRECW